MTKLAIANEAFKRGDYSRAIELYDEISRADSVLKDAIAVNLLLAKKN